MKSYAVLDASNVCVSIVSSASRPANSVEVTAENGARIGAYFDGWTFRGQTWTAYAFLNRFTVAELDGILAASKADPIALRFLALAQAAQEIDSEDEATVAGMAYLVAAGLLSSQRRDEILAV